MGIDSELGLAFAKSQLAAGQKLPTSGTVFISAKDGDKAVATNIAAKLHRLGFNLIATAGTHQSLEANGVPAKKVLKVSEGRPNIVDSIINGEVDLVINTAEGKGPASDAYLIRRNAIDRGLAYITTIAGAKATADAIEAMIGKDLDVTPLQDYYGK